MEVEYIIKQEYDGFWRAYDEDGCGSGHYYTKWGLKRHLRKLHTKPKEERYVVKVKDVG